MIHHEDMDNQTRFVGFHGSVLAGHLADLGFSVTQVDAGQYCQRGSTAWETNASQQEAMRVADYEQLTIASYSPVPQDGCR